MLAGLSKWPIKVMTEKQYNQSWMDGPPKYLNAIDVPEMHKHTFQMKRLTASVVFSCSV